MKERLNYSIKHDQYSILVSNCSVHTANKQLLMTMSGRVIFSSVILLGVILLLPKKAVLLCNNEYESTLSYVGCGFEGRYIQHC